jgi:hypothetical protein
VELSPLPGDTTWLARPNLTGKGVNRWNPVRSSIMGIGNRLNTTEVAWDWATITSGAGTDSVEWSYNWGRDSLVLGENFVCCVPFEDQAATTGNGSPFAGNMEVYPIYRIGLAGGVEESHKLQVKSNNPVPTIVRGVLYMPRDMTETSDVSDRVPRLLSLLDVSGRKVMSLKQGENDMRRLPPGVYFFRSRTDAKVMKILLVD